MASNFSVPETLKQVKPYMTLADQLDQKGDRAAAYYCRFYAVQTAMTINKTAPDCKKFLLQLMDTLEKVKAQLKGEESVKDDTVGQAFMEKYVLSLFKKADDDDREGKFSRNLIKQFYSAGLLFDVLNTFGDLSEDLVGVKKYAKMKAMYIKKCLDAGETPIAGPLVSDDAPNYEIPKSDQPPQSPPPVTPYPVKPSPSLPQPTVSPPRVEKPAASDANADVVVQAQKFCKFAASALQYEDIPTAIDNLEKCLRILKTGK